MTAKERDTVSMTTSDAPEPAVNAARELSLDAPRAKASSPAALLRQLGLKPRRGLSQSFLTDHLLLGLAQLVHRGTETSICYLESVLGNSTSTDVANDRNLISRVRRLNGGRSGLDR